MGGGDRDNSKKQLGGSQQKITMLRKTRPLHKTINPNNPSKLNETV
jgi:hypothetical protein